VTRPCTRACFPEVGWLARATAEGLSCPVSAPRLPYDRPILRPKNQPPRGILLAAAPRARPSAWLSLCRKLGAVASQAGPQSMALLDRQEASPSGRFRIRSTIIIIIRTLPSIAIILRPLAARLASNGAARPRDNQSAPISKRHTNLDWSHPISNAPTETSDQRANPLANLNTSWLDEGQQIGERKGCCKSVVGPTLSLSLSQRTH